MKMLSNPYHFGLLSALDTLLLDSRVSKLSFPSRIPDGAIRDSHLPSKLRPKLGFLLNPVDILSCIYYEKAAYRFTTGA
jgi:hypothetical protein